MILLDAMMPNMSGTEVLEQLRDQGSKIPVLMISAHLDAQEPDRMRSLGASDCIPKPFEWEDLIGKIEELAGELRRRRGFELRRGLAARDLHPDLLALQLRPVEVLDGPLRLIGGDLDEGEAVQHPD